MIGQVYVHTFETECVGEKIGPAVTGEGYFPWPFVLGNITEYQKQQNIKHFQITFAVLLRENVGFDYTLFSFFSL